MLDYVRTLPFIWLLSAILLNAQFSALLHGIQHPFHIAGSHCKVYSIIEHQSHGLCSVSFPLLFPFVQEQAIVILEFFILPIIEQAFWARAPPSIQSTVDTIILPQSDHLHHRSDL